MSAELGAWWKHTNQKKTPDGVAKPKIDETPAAQMGASHVVHFQAHGLPVSFVASK